MRFTKVEGAGNDYVLVDTTDGAVTDPQRLARRVSDRHLGVGSDGLLLLGPGIAPAHATMRIFNADGSEGRMCGNGLRCVVRYLYELQYLRFSAVSAVQDPGPYLWRSTWFDADYFGPGILTEDQFTSLADKLGCVCDAYRVDESRFVARPSGPG